MDIQEAYKVLGVAESATDKEIEDHYMKWIKRHNTNQNKSEVDNSINIESINAAYRVIKTYREFGTESPEKSYTFSEKIEHFFHYYKLHVIGVIALIILVISGAQTFIDHRQEQKELANLPPKSVSIMFYGSYIHSNLTSSSETERLLNKNILAKFPSWERVETILNYAPREVNGGSDIGIQQKSAAILATKKPDVYIMDLEFFQIHVDNGMFYAIDELGSAYKEQAMDQLYYGKAETDTTEHLYGIEITDESIFDGVSISDSTKKIAAIRRDAHNKENAMELILKLSNID